jgi:LPS O-antigen subunit length determinant protein (WzzB/FepE family)
MAKDKKKSKDKKPSKELLVVEYQELCSNVRTFWNFRITILGFSITIIGVLFTHLIKPQFLQKLTLEICLMFIIFALIKTMISLTRHLVVYSLRLKEIEVAVDPNSFWTRWGKYLKDNSKDSNSKTISIIVNIINIVVSVFILFINCMEFTMVNGQTEKIILIIVSLFVIACSIYNFVQLNKYLNPTNHWNDIKDEWNKTKS